MLDLGGGHGPRASDPPSRGAHVGRALCRPAPRTRGHTWLPPPALRRSRPPPPWKPQAAGRVILACARAAAAPARYRTHLARVRGDSVPHPTPESRPPATPEPHPTHRTRVLGARKVGSILGAHMPRTAAFSGAAVLQQRRVPGPRTVRRSSYNTGGCTPGSARHRDGHPQPCCTPVTSAHTRTLAHSCGAGCALVWAMRWGDARVVDASGLRSGAMHGPRARTATVAEPSSTLVGPQQRARAHDEEQPGDAASFGEGGR